ncbi:MAG: prepilin-type N-terminal cleavage/methylation domain-containing protein [Kiritimatiellia bacterium]|jgi:prepilin-type N-terminal cleavage/methylation domain-containing protein
MKNRCSAFTLFELLAVLAVTGVILMVALGSYNSWASMHACTGAARIMKAGLNQAHALAQSKCQYVLFDYNNAPINGMSTPQFQIYICSNVTSTTEVFISDLTQNVPIYDQGTAINQLGIALAAPRQLLPKHIYVGALASLQGQTEPYFPDHEAAHLAFRPDGSLLYEKDSSPQSHYIGLYTKRLFDSKPIRRYLWINLTTGSVETIVGE